MDRYPLKLRRKASSFSGYAYSRERTPSKCVADITYCATEWLFSYTDVLIVTTREFRFRFKHWKCLNTFCGNCMANL